MKTLLGYGTILVILMMLDALWLGFVVKDFYRQHIGHLFGDRVVWWAAVLFYLLYAAAVVYFAVLPAPTILGALCRGAFLGFTAYMTYDLTNQATLRDWPILITVADIAWGACITALAAMAAKWVFVHSATP